MTPLGYNHLTLVNVPEGVLFSPGQIRFPASESDAAQSPVRCVALHSGMPHHQLREATQRLGRPHTLSPSEQRMKQSR